MKIKLEGFDFLKDRLISEGNELVEMGEEIKLSTKTDGPFPAPILEALGIKVDNLPETYRIVKFFNYDFSPQTIVTIPIVGMMQSGLGFPLESGLAARFIDKEPDIFSSDTLIEVLREMHYVGFVYAAYNTDKLCSFGLGAGMYIYNLLESLEGKLTSFINLEDRLLESWTLSVVLSRYPFPFRKSDSELCFKVTPQAKRHLHLFNTEKNKSMFYTSNTFLGIATSWATTLHEAENRVMRTLDGLDIHAKQYRKDLADSVQWYKIKDYVITS